MPRKILVTGSSGFIGYHLCKYLLSKKFYVYGIDSHNKYYSNSIKNKRLSILKKKNKFKFFKTNLINEKKLDEIFKRYSPNIVFHLAGQPGVLYSFKNPKSYYLNNEKATKSLCKISKKNQIKKFFLGSSSSVYGDQKKFPIKENAKLNPKNVYAITKLKSEKIVNKTFKKSKIDFIIFRFFTVYGSYGRPDMFIHKFLKNVKFRKLNKIYNNGLNFRDFTFVDDVVKILVKSINIKTKNSIINICRSKPIITQKLIDIILKYYPVKSVLIKKTKPVKGEMFKTHGNNNKLKKIFGKIKFTDIEIGLKKTIKDFIKYNM
tara:strand:- start:376 stop:1332 length:957 start_codon:yes stop_codon:yes gene_type:complete